MVVAFCCVMQRHRIKCNRRPIDFEYPRLLSYRGVCPHPLPLRSPFLYVISSRPCYLFSYLPSRPVHRLVECSTAFIYGSIEHICAHFISLLHSERGSSEWLASWLLYGAPTDIVHRCRTRSTLSHTPFFTKSIEGPSVRIRGQVGKPSRSQKEKSVAARH